MMPRRDTLLGAVAALVVSAPAVSLAAGAISRLPRRSVELVASPFVHAHQQATNHAVNCVGAPQPTLTAVNLLWRPSF